MTQPFKQLAKSAPRVFDVTFSVKKGFTKTFKNISASDDERALGWAKVQAIQLAKANNIKVDKINIKIDEVAVALQTDKKPA